MYNFTCVHCKKSKPIEERGYGNQCTKCQLDIYYTGSVQK